MQTNLPLKIVIVGHVDHGKSTLVGRLFHDTGSMPDGKVEAIKAMCERRGMPFECAFLMDALKAERDQGITIDVSHIHFRTAQREYVLIDAPGHREFIKNMVTGAAQADAAVLVVDAREGVQEQTRRHAYLLHLLGIQQVIVAINKMDLVDFGEARFQTVAVEVRDYLAGLGIDLQHTRIIPVSARDGDNIVAPSAHMNWYEGDTLADALDEFQPPLAPLDLPLRFPIQDVYKFDERRILAGRIESGHLRRGDRAAVLAVQQDRARRLDRVVERQGAGPCRARRAVGRHHPRRAALRRARRRRQRVANPPMLTNVFRGRLFWLGRQPLTPGNRYKMKLCTAEFPVEVEKIERVIDVSDLGTSAGQIGRAQRRRRGGVPLRAGRSPSIPSRTT